jgi:hypothetical protein
VALLRDGLLGGRAIATVAVGRSLRDTLAGLGARVEELSLSPGFGEDEERVGEWARERSPLHAVVYAARAEERTDRVWAAVREVAVGALIPGEHPGKVVLIGPRPDAGEGAAATRAALESLARTLSVEWARFGVTAVMVAPGARSSDGEVAQLVCFLCSHAGEYLSGCRLQMR